jgi:hypothetical protein
MNKRKNNSDRTRTVPSCGHFLTYFKRFPCLSRSAILKFSQIFHSPTYIFTFKNSKDEWRYIINNIFSRSFYESSISRSFRRNALHVSWKSRDKTNTQLQAQLKVLLYYCIISTPAHIFLLLLLHFIFVVNSPLKIFRWDIPVVFQQ